MREHDNFRVKINDGQLTGTERVGTTRHDSTRHLIIKKICGETVEGIDHFEN